MYCSFKLDESSHEYGFLEYVRFSCFRIHKDEGGGCFVDAFFSIAAHTLMNIVYFEKFIQD